MIDEKTCTGCGVTKPEQDFMRRRRAGEWLGLARCRDCKNAYMREYNQRPGMKEKKQRVQWRNKYQLSAEDYFDLFEKQEGCCAICNNPASEARLLDVDHDHECCKGKKSCGICVRGLLCQSCNGALGLVRDSIPTLSKMIAYVETHQAGKK